MMTLSGRQILLGVSGGIAAYKACEVVRRLRDLGAEVRVVMTESANRFVSPLSFQALSGSPVRCELFDEAAEAGMGHIELARWADLLVIAPGTANLMAKMATVQADDLLTTLVLATEAKVLLAPAMNRVMWENPAVQANAATLAARGVRLLGPAEGAQACGENGAGRMVEPAVIVDEVITHFTARQGPLAGKKVVITAGGTREPIDPVRFIANRSSGRMGYALAQAAVEAGAEVILVSGPSTLAVPAGVECTKVETALQMLKAVQQALPADVFIGAAAVADY
ncbi:MAG TPA: bifunctional phosphopantothenoylcysteine decarboxylase/phosphopantothenate--cysteine ligase CoaBC, partial [Halothiobacillus sp.]|nr:bifunctional phosphopantothenoylcysteine decarboxylase/phosphopantothenate--cysteine ligase CoaBC [Halothiobacillus sp.]